MEQSSDLLFELLTPLGISVRTTHQYWGLLQQKHPEITGRLRDMLDCLANPEQVRRSRIAPAVYLFYGPAKPYHLCIVVERLDGEGFVVTCYITDAIKEGARIWPTSE